MSNLILIITAGVSGIISLDRSLTLIDIPLSLFIIVLGFFGLVFSMKYGFRISYHLSVSRKVLERSSGEVYRAVDGFQRRAEVESDYQDRFSWVVRPNNTKYWLGLHGFVILYGVFLCVLCVVSFMNRMFNPIG